MKEWLLMKTSQYLLQWIKLKASIIVLILIFMSCTKDENMTFEELVANQVVSKKNEFKQSVEKIFEKEKDELENIALLEFTVMGWEDIVCWTCSKEDLSVGGSFGYVVKSLVDSDFMYEWIEKLDIERQDKNCDEIYIETLAPHVQNFWDSINSQYKKYNAVLLIHDDTRAYWLNERKWIKRTDKNYAKLFK